ncbi:nucleotide exchange factor GrpE [Neolewinella antarctica]|uniref:Protein GrpE n=1 Tax=Neolewinella antarctica TaxID=442734 RepID=A0ABX0X8R5_9BACT|nr:nucleotide exchange factor GrpE [Neolewinella antarctica]NJC25233.1 molecular chaperone GrpE [Neolewinella antarctica]
MSKNTTDKDSIVNDELLENAGAGPEGQTVGDSIEEELEDYQEPAATASNENLIASLEDQIAEKDDRHLRLYAEFENYKRRSQREKLDLMGTAGKKTMLALLPVLDDFDRAQKQAESDEGTKQIWESGVGLIRKKLLKNLGDLGLKTMESTGEDFNADLHEAITEIPSPQMAGKVVDTTERGYTLNGTIIRHAKVVVGK